MANIYQLFLLVLGQEFTDFRFSVLNTIFESYFQMPEQPFLSLENIPVLNDFHKLLCDDNLQIENISKAFMELQKLNSW